MLGDMLKGEIGNLKKGTIDMWCNNYDRIHATLGTGPTIEVGSVLFGNHFKSSLLDSGIDEKYIYPILLVNGLLGMDSNSSRTTNILLPDMDLVIRLYKLHQDNS